jgi:glycosyltransferase involved in cell wall biosynthesis
VVDVIVIANDIVPGFGLPVAAPGLRAHGLAKGLRANGLDAIVTVPLPLVEREWLNRSASVSWPSLSRTIAIADTNLASFVQSQKPLAVVLTNSNKFTAVQPIRETKYIYDFFAPKMKELAEISAPDREKQLAELRARKLSALDRVEAVIVNGQKKVPYVLEWLEQTKRGIDDRPVVVVDMPIENCFAEPIDAHSINVAMAGYLVPWIRFGKSLEALHVALNEIEALRLHLLMPEHWGGAKSQHPDQERLSEIRKHNRTRARSEILFDEYQRYLSRMDVFIDLFTWSAERELAMVTRTVTAIGCGLPVVHPTFTECSPLIAKYDAGWLVDPQDGEGLVALLRALTTDRELLTSKRAGAQRLAREMLSPEVATRPLVALIKSWQ